MISGSYPPLVCGVGDYSYNLARALADLPKTHVSVLTSTGGCEHNDMGGKIEVISIMKGWRVFELLKVVKVILLTCPDIIHIQYPTQGYKNGLLPLLLPILGFLMRKKIVQTWHEFPIKPFDCNFYLKAIVTGGLVVVRPQYLEMLHPKLRSVLKYKKVVFIRSASAIPKITLNEGEYIKIRKNYIKKQKRLVVFFGFINQNKGTELLFDIADPDLDQIIIAGQFGANEYYNQKIKQRAIQPPWEGKVTITGYISSHDVAALLAVADAVILPFCDGGGIWNTSIHAAELQGAFILTTTRSSIGFDKERNIYFSEIDDIQSMRMALNTYAGKFKKSNCEIENDEWLQIAVEHQNLYKALLH
ncbi:MAG: hypothetical protein KGI54_11810 [Pseudomonadota bacterium]|nr:hypothetical protein [Pseudomonadota bacterium]